MMQCLVRKLRWRTIFILLACTGTVARAVPPAIDTVNNEISIVMTQEPQWLNTVKATDQVSFIVLDHITEGLMTHDINNQLVGGVAERWELTDDTATFWLRERGVAMLGSDGTNDVIPSGVDGVSQPIHQLTLVAMGMPLFDYLDLEAVAREAARQNRWEFLLVAAPLAVDAGTGSPLNPLAIF